jgi:succinyl-CoA synthetase alpha subunit
MGVLLDRNSKIIVQGITGHQGKFHTKAMVDIGTKIVAGVTPGKGGSKICGVSVYDDVKSAVKATGANASAVFVPAQFAKDAVIEAIDGGIKLVVVITEHIPSHDMLDLLLYARENQARIIGPNCPGIATPGVGKIGIIPNMVLKRGKIGVISRSGTLTYEVVDAISRAGFGESTVVGIGGDKIPGTTFSDVLKMFEKDDDTGAVVMVGEIGGTAEEEAAEIIKRGYSKPVVAFIAGVYAPHGKKMGHAGAIISGNKGTAKSKIDAFRKAGVHVANSIDEIPLILKKELL